MIDWTTFAKNRLISQQTETKLQIFAPQLKLSIFDWLAKDTGYRKNQIFDLNVHMKNFSDVLDMPDCVQIGKQYLQLAEIEESIEWMANMKQKKKQNLCGSYFHQVKREPYLQLGLCMCFHASFIQIETSFKVLWIRGKKFDHKSYVLVFWFLDWFQLQS